MEKVIITSIYDEIIEYYTNNTFDDLEEEDIKSKKEYLEEFDIDINQDSNKEKVSFGIKRSEPSTDTSTISSITLCR